MAGKVLPEGTVLEGRYRIIRLLGQGGMSRVYLAVSSPLELQVAIKENLQAGAEAQTQFQREAQILAGLSHANLPRVHDYFVEPRSGRQYLVMSYVEGEDLESMVRRAGPIAEATALAWVRQIMDALQHMHDQTPPVIHRDVKPGNIKITPEGRAVLVDFGIAKLYDAKQQTLTGARAVTPGYAPPEQYGLRTSTRSDIYALGATLYTMLTGKTPPEAPVRVSGEADLLPASSLAPRGVSPGTEDAIRTAMALESSKRWQSIGEFSAALSPRAPTVTREKPIIRQPKPRAKASARPIFAVAGLVLVGAVALLMWGAGRPAASPALPLSAGTPTGMPDDGGVTAATVAFTRTPRPTYTPLGMNATPSATNTVAPATSTPAWSPTITVARTVSPTPTAQLAAQAGTATRTPTPVVVVDPGAPSGRIAFAVVDGSRMYKLYMVNADGTGLTSLGQCMRQPSFRPDGQRLVVNGEGCGRDDIYSFNLDRSGEKSETNMPVDQRPIYTLYRGSFPILFYSPRSAGGQTHIYRDSANLSWGSGVIFGQYPVWVPPEDVVYAGCDYGFGAGSVCGMYRVSMWGGRPNAVSRTPGDIPTDADVGTVLFTRLQGSNWDVYSMAPDGGALQRLTTDAALDGLAEFSPDGRFIAFVSNRSGAWGLWLMNRDGSNQRLLMNLPEGGGLGTVNDWTTERISWGQPPAAAPAPPTPVGAGLLAAPVFVWPKDGDRPDPNHQYPVSWTWSGLPLGDNQAFELRMQPVSGKTPYQGIVAPLRALSLDVLFNATPAFLSNGRTTYYLQLVVVQLDPYKTLSLPATVRITLDPG